MAAEYGVFGRRFTSDGAPNGGEFPVNTTSPARSAADLDTWTRTATSSWSGTPPERRLDIFGRRFLSYGQPIGVEFQINSLQLCRQRYPQVGVRSDGDFVVVWDSTARTGTSKGVFARRYDSAGTPLAAPFLVNVYTIGAQVYPAIGMEDDGDFVVAWSGSGSGAQWHLDPPLLLEWRAAGDEFRMSIRTGVTQLRAAGGVGRRLELRRGVV